MVITYSLCVFVGLISITLCQLRNRLQPALLLRCTRISYVLRFFYVVLYIDGDVMNMNGVTDVREYEFF